MTLVRWAVLGVGNAGRARARAIVADPRARLVALHRGRFASSVGDELGVPVLSAAASIDAADAVAICGPNEVHVRQARSVLDAGRHALVEFPLASTRREAEDLFQRARSVGRVLHVEHIEILSGSTRALLGAGTLLAGEMEHAVLREREVPKSELVALLVPRLHRLRALLGPLIGWEDRARGPGWLEVTVTLRDGAIRLRLCAGPGLQRMTHLRLMTSNGLWEMHNRTAFHDGAPLALPAGPGLFVADQLVATSRIIDAGGHYVSNEQILSVLLIAEEIAGEEGLTLS